MTKTPEQLRLIYLSGTVSIPPRFPDLADITIDGSQSRSGDVFVVATHRISPKLVIKRTFFAQDISALFIPLETSRDIDLEKGEWFFGEKLADKIFDSANKSDPIEGIIYVREDAQSILEMETGLTAAESAEYYPPLPDDRSVNHYSMGKAGGCH